MPLSPLNITRQIGVIRNGLTDSQAGAALASVISDVQNLFNSVLSQLNDLSALSRLPGGGLALKTGTVRSLTARFIFEDLPDIQNVAAAGQQLIPLGEDNRLKNTSGGNLTLTNLPTIAPGKNEQWAHFINVGVNNIVLQDRGTLANSGLFLVANTRTLAPRSNITLRYSVEIGGWVERGFSAVL